MQVPKDQKGFAVLEGILAVLLVIAIGSTVYFAYQAGKNNTTPASPVPKPTVASSATPASTIDDAAAATMVQTFYSQYLQDSGSSTATSSDPSPEQTALQAYATPSFIASLSNPHNANPVVCAQDVPDSATVTSHAVSGTSAVVSVKELFGNDSEDIKVTVINQNGLKINAVTCPSAT